jgi:hypothetical protein
MSTTEEVKKCLHCGRVLKGRIDKKFCDDGCRNNYNNNQNSNATNYVRNVVNALRKNRRILEEYITQSDKETAKSSKKKMYEQGFDFNYHTHIYTTKEGKVYYFNFEYGYLLLEHDWVFIVKRKQNEA